MVPCSFGLGAVELAIELGGVLKTICRFPGCYMIGFKVILDRLELDLNGVSAV